MPQLFTSHDPTGPVLLGASMCHFCNTPKLSCEQAIKCICHYLCSTRNKGLFFLPDLHAGFTCHVDATWAGHWLKSQLNDKTCALAQTGFLIWYVNCLIVWGSKMQTLVVLSTTEAEIIALSSALREVIHLQNLLKELHSCNFPIPFTKP